MKKFGIQLTMGLFALLFAFSLQAQDKPAPSPLGKVYQRLGVTDVEIVYSRPGVKGRTVFAAEGLQSYGKLWRTGANAATTISFSTDVMVGGKKVAAGKYSVFSVPGAEKWKFMINSNAELRGTRNYDEAKNAVSLELTPTEYPSNVETMTFVFANVTDTSMDLMMFWEKTVLTIPITVEKTWE